MAFIIELVFFCELMSVYAVSRLGRKWQSEVAIRGREWVLARATEGVL